MYSGGGTKESPYTHIYIEAKEDEATVIFYNRFGHNPNRVTCTCCGPDYSIIEGETLAEITAFDRGCKYLNNAVGYVESPSKYAAGSRVIPLDEFCQLSHVLVIRSPDIKPEWRRGNVPHQGFAWLD